MAETIQYETTALKALVQYHRDGIIYHARLTRLGAGADWWASRTGKAGSLNELVDTLDPEDGEPIVDIEWLAYRRKLSAAVTALEQAKRCSTSDDAAPYLAVVRDAIAPFTPAQTTPFRDRVRNKDGAT